VADERQPVLVGANHQMIHSGSFEFLLEFGLGRMAVAGMCYECASGFRFDRSNVACGRQTVFERIAELQYDTFMSLTDLTNCREGLRVVEIAEDEQQGAVEQ
jgi:hypothetical protein